MEKGILVHRQLSDVCILVAVSKIKDITVSGRSYVSSPGIWQNLGEQRAVKVVGEGLN